MKDKRRTSRQQLGMKLRTLCFQVANSIPPGFWQRLGRGLRDKFILGIFIIAPIGVTILILKWFFSTIDNFLQPIIRTLWGRTIPGVGLVTTVVLIYLAGFAASNIAGKRLIGYGESLLARVPIVRQLYNGIKQILESFSQTGKTGFMQVVLIEFPRKGMKAIGFVTNESSDESGQKLLNIFIPTSPNPTSGFLQIVREEEIIRTRMSVDEALKMVISAGKVTPRELGNKLSSEN